jgi:hypothetical protein
MYIKNNKFFADWRDDSGRRLRKSFTTAKAATTYEAAQRVRHPKQKAGGPSRKSYPSSPTAKTIQSPATATRAARPVSSLQLRAVSSRTNSTLRTPTTSTLRSPKVVTLTRRGATPQRRSSAS